MDRGPPGGRRRPRGEVASCSKSRYLWSSPAPKTPPPQPAPRPARSGWLLPRCPRPSLRAPAGSSPDARAPPCALRPLGGVGCGQAGALREGAPAAGGRGAGGRRRAGGCQAALRLSAACRASRHGLQHEETGVGRGHLLHPSGAGEAVRPGPRGPDVGRAGSTPVVEPGGAGEAPRGCLPPPRCGDTLAPHIPYCCAAQKRERARGGRPLWPYTQRSGSCGRGTEPGLGPVAWGEGSGPTVSTGWVTPLPWLPPQEGRGHRAAPASPPFPGSESGRPLEA